MHPIEHLRYVARSSGMPHSSLIRETASAMMSFADDPAGLLTACRRMVSRQPESGAQVTLAARMLTAPSARRAAWDMIEELDDDRSPRDLVDALPDASTVCMVGWPETIGHHLPRRGDVDALIVHTSAAGWGHADRLLERDVEAVDIDPDGLGAAARTAEVTVLEAVAAGPDTALVGSGGLAAAAVAAACGRQVWLLATTGTVLPAKMYDGLLGRYELDGDPWDLDHEIVPLELVHRVFGPAGATDTDAVLNHSCCPIAPELFT